jgi:hypothetical protein
VLQSTVIHCFPFHCRIGPNTDAVNVGSGEAGAAELKPSRRWVLQALRAGGAMQTVAQLGDRTAADGHQLKARTIQEALIDLGTPGWPPAPTRAPGWPATGQPQTPIAHRSTVGMGATGERRQGPRGGPREPRERGVARGPAGWPPQPPRGRPVAAGARGVPPWGWPGGSPYGAAVPRGPRRAGWSANSASPPSAAGPHRPHLSGCHVLQRERSQLFPGISIPASAAVGAAPGRSGPSSGR